MPTLEILSPGVYGFERTPQRAPEGLSPAKAGFVGWTDEGPSSTPIQIRSVEEFRAIFGDISTLGLVPIEVSAFFATGGERAYIVRVVAADAVAASVEVDPLPGPTKWTFRSRGEGVWGNDTTVRIRGNLNFLDRTPGAPAWEKFDLLVIRPFDADPSLDNAEETYEAIQFSDPDAGDYLTTVLADPRRPSLLIEVIEGIGGVPDGLLGSTVVDEVVAVGNGILTTFVFALASTRVLDGSVRIVAGGVQNNDVVQAPTTGVINSVNTNFVVNLPGTDILDDSVRFYFAKTGDVIAATPAVIGAINGINTTFQIASGTILDKIHRETAVFRIRYAAVAPASPQLLFVVPGAPTPYDLSVTPLTSIPVHPGTVAIAVDVFGFGPFVIVDDGAGGFPVSVALPAGGTINYATGAMTGITAPLTPATLVVATYNISNIITKAATADNAAQNVALVGSVGVGTNEIDLVNSVAAPTAAGQIDFVTLVAPIAGTTIFVDYVRLGVISDNLAGVLSGDVGAPVPPTFTNTVDFTSGIASFVTDVAPKTGSTIDADWATGLVVTDNGLGALVGAVNPAGNNTINYDTGAVDVTFSSAPIAAPILANYDVLDLFLDFPLTGGLNGSAVTRSDISLPGPLITGLEAQKKGIYALDRVEEPLNVVVPDFEGSQFVQFDLTEFATNRADSRYMLMGFANGTTVDEAIQYNLVTQAWDKKIGALYYPNIYFVNPLTERPELIPVTGFAAGVYAKTANNKNVGKAPGGVEDGALDGEGTVGPEFVVELADRDRLYQARINPIISSIATGLAVWGVRSLSKERRWRYINARTLHNFLMHSTALQLQWAVFENNGPPLWAKIETALKGYYGSLFRLGYFAGEIEEDAFFVKCNSTNNNQVTISQGKAIIDLGFAPSTPAEFIIFSLQQPVGQQASLV